MTSSGRPGSCGRYGLGGLGVPWAVLSGLGSGDVAQGHFEAEGAELAGMVGDLAADVALAS